MVCLGVRDVWGGIMDMESYREGTPTRDILTNPEVVHAPNLLCGKLMGLG